MTKIYNYTPTDDLTLPELSDLMKMLLVSLIEGIQGQDVKGDDDLQIDDVIYNAMRDRLKRHFTEFEDPSKPIPPDTIKNQH